jgi:hypothetical protein
MMLSGRFCGTSKGSLAKQASGRQRNSQRSGDSSHPLPDLFSLLLYFSL